MPKEYTHLIIGREVMDRAGGRAGKVLASYPREFLLGAIAPDSLFYLEISPAKVAHRKTAARIKNLFHSPPEGFFPRLVFSSPDDRIAAFALGLVCHGIADHVFHPLIRRLSRSGMGAGENPAVRHVGLECALDLLLAGTLGKDLKKMSPAGLVGLKRGIAGELFGFYGSVLAGFTGANPGVCRSLALKGLKIQCRVLELVKNNRAARLASRANFLSGGRFSRYEALFFRRAPQIADPGPFLNLFDYAVDVSVSLCRAALSGRKESVSKVLSLIRP